MNITKSTWAPWALPFFLVLLFVLSLAWLTYGNFQSGSERWQILLEVVLLSVPLGLMYISIGVLVTAAGQMRSGRQIGSRLTSFIYHTPRIAGLLIILFAGMFALDGLSIDQSIRENIVGFFIHALPAVILAIVVALAWKWEWIGFVALLAAAIFFLRFLIRNPFQGLSTLLLFVGPVVVVALLFWANWRWRDALHRV